MIKAPGGAIGRGDLWALGGFGALVGGMLFPVLFRGRAFFEWDISLLWHTQVKAFAEVLARGSWPVWNPGVAFGQPLLADANHQVFYPLTWLHPFFSPATYHTVFVAFHLLLTAAGIYVLGRRLGFSRVASFGAGALWTASGPLVSLVYVWNHFVGACWIPWVVWSAESALASGRPSHALRWGVVTALQVFAGSPDMVLYTQVIVAAHALHFLGWRREADRRRPWGAVLLAAVAAIALSAAQWLPSLEVVSRSAREDLSYATQAYWSMHPLTMLETALPLFAHDLPLTSSVGDALFGPRRPFLDSVYLGAPALVLAAAAFTTGGIRRRRSWIVLAALGMLLAAGRHTPFHEGLLKLVPPFAILRYPVKAFVMTGFGIVLLAGAGIDAWRNTRPAGRKWTLVAGGGVLLALINGFAAFAFGTGRETLLSRFLATTDGLGPHALRFVVAAVVAGGLIVAAAARFRKESRWVVPVILALALADLLFAHRHVNPTVPRSSLSYRPPTVDLVRNPERLRIYTYDYYDLGRSPRYLGRDDPFPIVRRASDMSREEAQLLGIRTYLFPPTGSLWGLEGSYDMDFLGLYPKPLDALVRSLRTKEGTPAHDRLLQLGAVGRVIALHAEDFERLEKLGTTPSPFPEPVSVFGVPDPLPRTYAVGSSRAAAGTAALDLLASAEFDPAREIVLAEGPSSSAAPSFRGASRIASYAPDRVVLEAELSEPGYVVLVDAYDPGWKAEIDGERAPVLRANVAFRAVRVPAGLHVIEYRYRPGSILLGLAVSAVALLGILAAGVVGTKRGTSLSRHLGIARRTP